MENKIINEDAKMTIEEARKVEKLLEKCTAEHKSYVAGVIDGIKFANAAQQKPA